MYNFQVEAFFKSLSQWIIPNIQFCPCYKTRYCANIYRVKLTGLKKGMLSYNGTLSRHCSDGDFFLGAKLLYKWLCLSVCTPLAFLYKAIVNVNHNGSLLILGNEPSPPLFLLMKQNIWAVCKNIYLLLHSGGLTTGFHWISFLKTY